MSEIRMTIISLCNPVKYNCLKKIVLFYKYKI